MSLAERRIKNLSSIADGVRAVRIQIEEMKVGQVATFWFSFVPMRRTVIEKMRFKKDVKSRDQDVCNFLGDQETNCTSRWYREQDVTTSITLTGVTCILLLHVMPF